MSLTITDPAILEAIANAPGGVLELRDPDGRVIGVVDTGNVAVPPPGFVSPFTDEELEARKKDPTPGRTTAEVLVNLMKLR